MNEQTITDHGPLTISDVVALQTILTAAQQTRRVQYLLTNGEVVEGVARAIAHHGGGFLRNDEDVRDGYLHVSQFGEVWLPIKHVMEQVKRGEFVVDGVPWT